MGSIFRYNWGMKRWTFKQNMDMLCISQEEVGDGFQSWNEVIGTDCGTIIPIPGRAGDVFWCDENALLRANPVLNRWASLMAKRPIYGNVIMFHSGDIK